MCPGIWIFCTKSRRYQLAYIHLKGITLPISRNNCAPFCQNDFSQNHFSQGKLSGIDLFVAKAGGGQPPRTGQELSTRFFKRCPHGLSHPCGVRNLVGNRQASACEKPCGQLRSIPSAQYFTKNTCIFRAVVYNKDRKGAADERFLPVLTDYSVSLERLWTE